MSARHAVLGLVIERPGYGYDLVRRLEERCGAWGWASSNVYSALNQLERDKHVRSHGKKGSGNTGRAAPRVVYESTSEGVDFFREWIFKPSSQSLVRRELDLKLLFSGPEFLPRLIDETWAQEQRCVDDLQALTSGMQVSAIGGTLPWREAAVVLQRDAEIKLLQVRIEWLQSTRRVAIETLERAGHAT